MSDERRSGAPARRVVDADSRQLFRRIFRSLARPAASRFRNVSEMIALCHSLISERGEISGIRIATEILSRYRTLDEPARQHFFAMLSEDFWPDYDRLARAADAFSRDRSHATLMQLQVEAEPPRQEVFRRLNLAPGSTATLVDMRRRLLAGLGEHPEWSVVDHDLAHLFRSWFNGGFLVLRQIDWHTSAVVLERLIQYESVHQIQGWDDLHRRLAADRRCYAFFHPALPDDPLIFIEAALVRRMSETVQPLLDPHSPIEDPANATCAMFYSITNCQEGLRGVAFGNLLIKQVVEALRQTVPRVRTFATLSPVPGFRQWLDAVRESSTGPRKSSPLEAAEGWLDAGVPPPTNAADAERFRQELMQWCAYYLLRAKRGKAPIDPVARFHLANGARLERINWMADPSESGMRRSLGLMVNYVYRLRDVERNHEAYASEFRVVASHDIERLAKAAIKRPVAARS